MPSKKTKTPKTKKEQGIDEAKKFGKEMVGKLKILKKKYDKLDDKTKQNILTGLAGLAAVVASVGAAKRVKKKIKKRRSKK